MNKIRVVRDQRCAPALLLLTLTLTCPQVDVEKCYVAAEAGITVVDLQ